MNLYYKKKESRLFLMNLILLIGFIWAWIDWSYDNSPIKDVKMVLAILLIPNTLYNFILFIRTGKYMFYFFINRTIDAFIPNLMKWCFNNNNSNLSNILKPFIFCDDGLITIKDDDELLFEDFKIDINLYGLFSNYINYKIMNKIGEFVISIKGSARVSYEYHKNNYYIREAPYNVNNYYIYNGDIKDIKRKNFFFPIIHKILTDETCFFQNFILEKVITSKNNDELINKIREEYILHGNVDWEYIIDKGDCILNNSLIFIIKGKFENYENIMNEDLNFIMEENYNPECEVFQCYAPQLCIGSIKEINDSLDIIGNDIMKEYIIVQFYRIQSIIKYKLGSSVLCG